MLKHKPSVQFDPDNLEHIEAAHIMLTTGRQHDTLRFDVENPFHNAVDMIKHVMATRYASLVLRKEFIDVRVNDPLRATEADLQLQSEEPLRSTPSTSQEAKVQNSPLLVMADVIRPKFGGWSATSKH